MISTIMWRLKEAIAVLLGQKKTQKSTILSNFPERNLKNLPKLEYRNNELKKYIEGLKIEFIFSEFKEERVNAGGADLSQQSRLDPSLTTLRHYFSNAKFTVYSDFDLDIEGVHLHKVINPVLQNYKNNPRHYYHLADYYKFKGMLESKADIVISIDSDMFIFSEEIFSLIHLTDKFGFCVPNSSAQSMNFEIETSLDTKPINDESHGFGTTVNITPMTFKTSSDNGRKYYEACCEMLEKNPARASIIMWEAAWKTSVYPYLLPKEFCVCRGSEGIRNEVILHVGHPSVAKFYNINV